jgi:formate dehydrogenase (coenzyme F420) beta subunit
MAELVQTAKELLSSGAVKFIIGYAQHTKNHAKPFIARTPEEAEKLVFNHHCLNNLSVYINTLELPKEGKIGIVSKGCDLRSVTMLIQESQILRDRLYIIGVNCNGVVKDFDMDWSKENLAPKCAICKVREPKTTDVVIGEIEPLAPPEPLADDMVAKLDAMSPIERWNFWQAQFEKCIKCYACRQACPMCYCDQCIVDKNVPQWIESSSSARGNFSWNIVRAFHQAGRCTGCGECSRVCPMNIPLALLNKKMGMVAAKEFNFMPGMNADEPTLIGTYNLKDKNDFIM